MIRKTTDDLLADLVDIILVVSLPAIEQISWMDQQGFPADEMFLQLIDASNSFVPLLENSGYLSTKLNKGISAILRWYEATPVGTEFWSNEAIMHRNEWAVVRAIAREALQ